MHNRTITSAFSRFACLVSLLLLASCATDMAALSIKLAGSQNASPASAVALQPGSAIVIAIQVRKNMAKEAISSSGAMTSTDYLHRQIALSDADVLEFAEGARGELSQRLRMAGHLVVDTSLSGASTSPPRDLLANNAAAAQAMLPHPSTSPAYLLYACVPLSKSDLIDASGDRVNVREYSFAVPVLYVTWTAGAGEHCTGLANNLYSLRPSSSGGPASFSLPERATIGAAFTQGELAPQRGRAATARLLNVRPMSPREFGKHWASAVLRALGA